MALFDFSYMGKEYLNQRKTSSKSKRKQRSGSAESDSQFSMARSEGPLPVAPEGVDDCAADFGELCIDDKPRSGSIGELSDATAVTDDGDLSTSSDSEGSIRSGTSFIKRKTKSALKHVSSSLSFFRSKKDKGEDDSSSVSKELVSETENPVVDKLSLAHYEPISVGESNQLTLSAFEAGYGPAFKLLKTMNRGDREAIMKMLFIKRSTEFYNDERDSYNILFSKIFGIRARTNTALRSARIMNQSTWVHSVLKVATALELSTRMVISSGDWRLPTRITERMTHKQAIATTTTEFNENASELLWKAERKFYKKLQKNLAARIGKKTSTCIAIWVREQAGPELAHLFDGVKELKPSKDSSPSRTGSAILLTESMSSTESGSDIEFLDLESSFHISQMVRNIEKVKPGFGRFVILVIYTFALRAKVQDGEFTFTNKKEMVKKLAIVGAKDGIIGLSLGIPLATFVNPFLGFPLMFFSFVNLSMGSTEFNIIEPVCMILLHQLILATNGTSIHEI